jgi:hypothetical protein
MKHAVSALMLAALGGLAGSAWAQNTDYRRGYDQGYRDALEAVIAQAQALSHNRVQVQPLPVPVPVEVPRLQILEANYGIRGALCDARPSVQQIVGMNYRNVEIRANNDLCGDPASGRPKRLSITYQCADGVDQRVAGPEGSVLNLSCR